MAQEDRLALLDKGLAGDDSLSESDAEGPARTARTASSFKPPSAKASPAKPPHPNAGYTASEASNKSYVCFVCLNSMHGVSVKKWRNYEMHNNCLNAVRSASRLVKSSVDRKNFIDLARDNPDAFRAKVQPLVLVEGQAVRGDAQRALFLQMLKGHTNFDENDRRKDLWFKLWALQRAMCDKGVFSFCECSNVLKCCDIVTIILDDVHTACWNRLVTSPSASVVALGLFQVLLNLCLGCVCVIHICFQNMEYIGNKHAKQVVDVVGLVSERTLTLK